MKIEDHLENLGKKYLPLTLPPEPMEIDEPQIIKQIDLININQNNPNVNNSQKKKTRKNLIKK